MASRSKKEWTMREMSRNGAQNGELGATAAMLIVALLHKPSVRDAAKECGISERTAWRYLQKPEFQKRFTEAKRQAMADALNAIQGASLMAVETLKRNMDCGNVFAENAAASTILSNALKAAEQAELLERVKRLEETMTKGVKRWA